MNPQFVLMYAVLLFLRPLYILVCGLVLRINGVPLRDIATWSRKHADKSLFHDLLNLAKRQTPKVIAAYAAIVCAGRAG